MNKILLNNNSRNHIKIFPLSEKIAYPKDEGEQIKWCEEIYKDLEQNGIKLYQKSDRKKGYLLSVWENDGIYYFVQSIRNEFKTYNNIIYLLDSKNDAFNICKFMVKNCEGLMKDYKELILEAKEENDKANKEISDLTGQA